MRHSACAILVASLLTVVVTTSALLIGTYILFDVLIDFIQLPDNERTAASAERKQSIRITTERIWHDTVRDLLYISAPPRSQQLIDKTVALRYWRDFGALFGLREGVVQATGRTCSLRGLPSTPSDRTIPYWLIPKRCFSNSCACSAVSLPCHRFRVCTGCRRVLYCGSQCQSL